MADAKPYDRVVGTTTKMWPVWVMGGLLGFTGLTAIGGGVEMLVFPQGNEFVPASWLAGIPLIDSWIVPGLFLAIILGVGSLLAAYGLFRGRRWGWLASIAVGVVLITWILLEIVLIPDRSFLEALYAGIGLVVLGLAALPSVRARFSVTESATSVHGSR